MVEPNNAAFNMPTRLPDFTFTTNAMYGYVPSVGAVMPSPTFVQGEDMYLTIFLEMGGVPVSLDRYKIMFSFKKSEHALATLFKTPITDVYEGKEGYYQIHIPAKVTALLRAGTYYFAFVLTDRGSGALRIGPAGTFNIVIGTPSPSPQLSDFVGELNADGDSVSATDVSSSVEMTEPKSPDIGLPL